MNSFTDRQVRFLAVFFGICIIATLIFVFGSNGPPVGTFVYEGERTDTAHVYVAIAISPVDGIFIIEEQNVWSGTYWLNKHGFEFVNGHFIAPPKDEPYGSSAMMILLFVRYKGDATRENMIEERLEKGLNNQKQSTPQPQGPNVPSFQRTPRVLEV